MITSFHSIPQAAHGQLAIPWENFLVFSPASSVSQWASPPLPDHWMLEHSKFGMGPLLSWTCIFSQGNFILLISPKYHIYATDFLIYIFVLISCLSTRFICNCLLDSSTQKWSRLLKQHLQNRAYSSSSPLISTNGIPEFLKLWFILLPPSHLNPANSISKHILNSSNSFHHHCYQHCINIHFLISNLIFEFSHPFNKKIIIPYTLGIMWRTVVGITLGLGCTHSITSRKFSVREK